MTPSDFLSEPFDPARLGALEAQDQEAFHAADRSSAMATGAAIWSPAFPTRWLPPRTISSRPVGAQANLGGTK